MGPAIDEPSMERERADVVVVTGATSGVGRATVRAFAERGAALGLLARGQTGLEAAAKEVEAAGGIALAVPTDVAEAEQVEAAIGSGAPHVVRAFSESFLGSLVHDVNLVHGLLERMGEPLPAEVIGGDWWNEGRAVSGSIRLANGARWDSAWIQLLATHEYREEVSLFFADSVRSLTFPSPWLKQYPTVYRRSERDAAANAVRVAQFYGESFGRELDHFHRCVTEDEPCRTPPEQARLDIGVLTQMFLAARPQEVASHAQG